MENAKPAPFGDRRLMGWPVVRAKPVGAQSHPTPHSPLPAYRLGVLVEQGRTARVWPGRGGHDEGATRKLDRAGVWVVDRLPDAALAEVRVGEQVGDRVQLPGIQAVRLGDGSRLGLRMLHEPGEVGALDLLEELPRARALPEVRVSCEVWPANHPQECGQPTAGGVDVDEAVAARPHAGGQRRSPELPARLHAVVDVIDDVRRRPVARARLRFVDRDIEVVALAGGLLAVECHHRRQGGDGPGLVERERPTTAEPERLAVRAPRPEHRPAHRLGNEVG